ncbi:MAG: response regulator, partial [Pseudomonadota bacterium]
MSHDTEEKTERHEILVVDDTLDSLQLLTRILTDHGYRVRPASGGALALRSAAARTPDLILLDVRMTDMDGYEVCRRLKLEARSRDIPVLFISGLGETPAKIKGFEAGGVDYITKPFQVEEVLARITAQLSLRMMQRQLEAQNTRLQLEIAEHTRTRHALQKAKDELEWRVEERTAELKAE